MTAGDGASLWRATCAEEVDAQPLEEDVSVDLAVVGGGFTGTAAALAAAEAGASACLVEAQEIGHGGSGRNVGLVNAGLWTPPDAIAGLVGEEAGERLVAILAAAPVRVFDLVERYQIRCEAVRAGTLHCAHAPSGMADLRERHRQQVARGAPVRLVSAGEARRLTGSPAVHGALLDPRAGTVHPLALVIGLARAAAARGARIAADTPVRAVRRDGEGWLLECGAARVRAGALLIATNAYHHAAREAAAPAFFPVHYFQIATAPLSAPRLETVLPERQGCWDTATVMSSFRRDAAGRLLVGGIGDLEGPAGGIHRAWARRKLTRLFPDLAAAPIEHAWCGRIAMTGDHLPKIVEFGPRALSIFGYSGRGIGPGITFGTLAAEALLSGDHAGLPVAPRPSHAETATGLRAATVEAGAALTHLLAARR